MYTLNEKVPWNKICICVIFISGTYRCYEFSNKDTGIHITILVFTSFTVELPTYLPNYPLPTCLLTNHQPSYIIYSLINRPTKF